MMDLYTAIKFANVGDIIITNSGKIYVKGSMNIDGKHVPAIFEEGHEEDDECSLTLYEMMEYATLKRR